MDILGYSGSGWLPFTIYLFLLTFLSWRSKTKVEPPVFTFLIQAAILVALLMHGLQLHDSVFAAQGFVFGFAQDLSLIAWVGLAFYWFQSWFLPIASLRWMVLFFALLCSALPMLFPGTIISPAAVSDPWFKGHFIVATIAVGLLTLAAMHAILMTVQDRALHRQLAIAPIGRSAHWLEDLPPLMTMESLLFNLLYVGFALLSLTVFSGLLFSQTLFGKPLVFDHKTIFALLSWFLFGSLLIARWSVGLRGRVALRWVLSAYTALLLAYAGSRFVLEVILQRA
ncbi:inner membrane protein YpjD [Polynucleobacter brandtiae]|uniref:ABC-type uncharacterized transport system permease subunit n=1 Tax=Polynucleobacter brandtiae TaxID=1938816 RepID=A0A2M8VRC6_9BURK|nr:ABC-type uncharacterized transport system permease subunit [Polynucleobacter brandtiae]